jgi:high-affinity Fe2+/Pb2+ permease
MNFSESLPIFVITLREGVEAALVVYAQGGFINIVSYRQF